MIELRHIPATGIVTHGGQSESQRKVERVTPAIHAALPNPPVQSVRIAVEILSNREAIGHRLTVKPHPHEVDGQPLDIVYPITLDVEGPGHPIARINEAMQDVPRRMGVQRRQLITEAEVVDDGTRNGIAWHVWHKAFSMLREPPGRGAARSAIAVLEISATVALMRNSVDVH